MCQLWWLAGDGYSDTMTILKAWALFERHIFIFRDQWLSNKRKQIFAHYLPAKLITIYCLLYYFVVMCFRPCKNIYGYTEKSCASSCLY
ncbi:unnamed protein product [Rotaria socialis]|uniref:Uncharacterized protein n=1 Tax=Rotaria socialis TaxID=392032 RepID=A0A821DPF4_9BILA|nr:unnamed protein product [Rotaria socialis]